MEIRLKRVYDPPEPSDGYRVLVDRLWPRGLRRDAANIDAWWRELAPSHELRRWVHADPRRWPDFRLRYLQELEVSPPEAVSLVDEARRHPALTLLTAVRDPERSHAAVLREWLQELLARG